MTWYGKIFGRWQMRAGQGDEYWALIIEINSYRRPTPSSPASYKTWQSSKRHAVTISKPRRSQFYRVIISARIVGSSSARVKPSNAQSLSCIQINIVGIISVINTWNQLMAPSNENNTRFLNSRSTSAMTPMTYISIAGTLFFLFLAFGGNDEISSKSYIDNAWGRARRMKFQLPYHHYLSIRACPQCSTLMPLSANIYHIRLSYLSGARHSLLWIPFSASVQLSSWYW